MKKQLAAIYTRVSSVQQKDEETINSQVDVLARYADENDFEVPPEWIFKDDGCSGSALNRAGLDELRNIIREYAVDVVLIYSPDRLARRYVDQLILIEEFKKQNVKLVSMKGSKNETPEEQLLCHFQGIFAEYERAQILDRSRRGRLYKARQGDKKILPKAPYGYVKDRNNFYAIDNQQALVVKEIFRLYTKENYSMRAICNHLVNKGISSPSGCLNWCPSTIRGVLRNTAYIGTAYYGKSEYSESDGKRIARYKGIGKVVKPKNAKKQRSKDLWHPISVPIIITESDFEASQELLTRNKILSSRNTKVPSMLQGLLVCGQCGYSYCKRKYGYGENTSKGTLYYCRSQLDRSMKWCGNKSLNQKHLDDIVWGQILQLLENPQLIEEEIRRRVEEDPSKRELARREFEVQKEQQKVKAAQDKILDAYQESDCLTLNDLKERIQKLKKREGELVKELESVRAFSILQDKQANLQLTVNQFSQHIKENEKKLTTEKRQQILRSLIDEIIIMPGEITIKHVIPLGSGENLQLCSANG